MNKEIIVEIAYQYGVKRVYVTSEHHEAIRSLTGQKTLTEANIKALKALGFSFKVANQEEV